MNQRLILVTGLDRVRISADEKESKKEYVLKNEAGQDVTDKSGKVWLGWVLQA